MPAGPPIEEPTRSQPDFDAAVEAFREALEAFLEKAVEPRVSPKTGEVG